MMQNERLGVLQTDTHAELANAMSVLTTSIIPEGFRCFRATECNPLLELECFLCYQKLAGYNTDHDKIH